MIVHTFSALQQIFATWSNTAQNRKGHRHNPSTQVHISNSCKTSPLGMGGWTGGRTEERQKQRNQILFSYSSATSHAHPCPRCRSSSPISRFLRIEDDDNEGHITIFPPSRGVAIGTNPTYGSNLCPIGNFEWLSLTLPWRYGRCVFMGYSFAFRLCRWWYRTAIAGSQPFLRDGWRLETIMGCDTVWNLDLWLQFISNDIFSSVTWTGT